MLQNTFSFPHHGVLLVWSQRYELSTAPPLGRNHKQRVSSPVTFSRNVQRTGWGSSHVAEAGWIRVSDVGYLSCKNDRNRSGHGIRQKRILIESKGLDRIVYKQGFGMSGWVSPNTPLWTMLHTYPKDKVPLYRWLTARSIPRRWIDDGHYADFKVSGAFV